MAADPEQLRQQFAAAMRAAGIGPLTSRPASTDPELARMAECQRQIDERHAERVRQWERRAPLRQLAERAMQRANARRAAELGLARGAGPVFAAAWADRPQKPVMWLWPGAT